MDDARLDVLTFKAWVVGDDFVHRGARREHVEDQRYPDAVATDARFAEADVWVDGDSREEVCAIHLDSSDEAVVSRPSDPQLLHIQRRSASQPSRLRRSWFTLQGTHDLIN